MTYTLEILRSAQRQLAKVEPRDQGRIISAIGGLTRDPRPPGSKKLSGRPAWRIRVGDYRVVFVFHDDRLLVLVVAGGHRKEVYRP